VEAEAGNKVKGKKDIAKEETGVGVSFGISSAAILMKALLKE